MSDDDNSGNGDESVSPEELPSMSGNEIVKGGGSSDKPESSEDTDSDE